MRTLDDIVKEQAEILGTKLLDLMAAAAEAQEVFTLDELEEYALNIRRGR